LVEPSSQPGVIYQIIYADRETVRTFHTRLRVSKATAASGYGSIEAARSESRIEYPFEKKKRLGQSFDLRRAA